MGFLTLVHMFLQFGYMGVHQSSFNRLEIAQSRVVASQQLIKLVNMSHVIFLLQCYVNDSLRNRLPDPVQKFGLSDDYFQFRCEVDEVRIWTLAFSALIAKNKILEILDCVSSVDFFPLVENLLLMPLIKLFGQIHVKTSYLTESGADQLIRFVFEFLDWSLDSSHYGSGPSN